MKNQLTVSNVYMQSHAFILTLTSVFVRTKPYMFDSLRRPKPQDIKLFTAGLHNSYKKIWQPPQNCRHQTE